MHLFKPCLLSAGPRLKPRRRASEQTGPRPGRPARPADQLAHSNVRQPKYLHRERPSLLSCSPCNALPADEQAGGGGGGGLLCSGLTDVPEATAGGEHLARGHPSAELLRVGQTAAAAAAASSPSAALALTSGRLQERRARKYPFRRSLAENKTPEQREAPPIPPLQPFDVENILI